MKTLLLFAALIGLSLISCTKDETVCPSTPQTTGTWSIHIQGNYLDMFHVVIYEPLNPPYNEVHYRNAVGNGYEDFKIDIVPNKEYYILYMDRDSVLKTISCNVTGVQHVYDTIPAMDWN